MLNIGPIDHLPAVQEAIISHGRTPAWLEQFKRFIVLHNQKLPKALQKLAQKFKGFVFSHTDFHTAINDIIHHPTKYGTWVELKNLFSSEPLDVREVHYKKYFKFAFMVVRDMQIFKSTSNVY